MTLEPAVPRSRGRRAIGLAVLVLAVALFLGGLVIWGLSVVPFAVFKARVDALAGDGSANGFTPALFATLVLKFRLFAALLLGTAVLLVLARRVIGDAATRALRALTRFFGATWRDIRDSASADGRGHLAMLGVIMAIGIALRLRFLTQPMRYDEANTFLEFATKPFYILLSNYSAVNNHPFHSALVRLSYLVFGDDPWAIRLPALGAGILMIPAAYLAARRFYNHQAALLAAGFVASSSILVEYSTNARGYTIVSLLFLLLVGLASLLTSRSDRGGWIVFAVLGAVGFFTVPIMLYPFGVVSLWLLMTAARGDSVLPRRTLFLRLVGGVAAAGVLTIGLYLPVFTVSGIEAVVANQYVVPQSFSYFAVNLATSARAVWAQWNRDQAPVVAVMVCVAFLAACIVPRLSRHRVPLALAALCWLAPVLLLQRVVPAERIWLFLLPIYLIMASGAIGRACTVVGQRAGRADGGVNAAVNILALALTVWGAVRVVSSGSVYRSIETGTLRDAEAIARDLEGKLGGGDRVLAVVPGSYPLAYYFLKRGIPVTHLLLLDPHVSCRLLVVVDTANAQTLDAVLVQGNVSPAGLGPPTVIQQYVAATLYRLDPTPSSPLYVPAGAGSCQQATRTSAASGLTP